MTGRSGLRPCSWWIVSDPCGLICANLTIGLIAYAQFAICKVVLIPWFGWISIPVIFYSSLSILNIYAHSLTQYSNPGAVPLSWTAIEKSNDIDLNSEFKFGSSASEEFFPLKVVSSSPKAIGNRERKPLVCMRCQTIKPKQAHHCSSCGRCIVNMDHHCPWANNCIGLFNQKYFLLFLAYTAMSSIFCAIFLVLKFYSCQHNSKNCPEKDIDVVLGIFNFVEALMFGIFTIIMLFDQLSAIFDNTPYIDAIQNRRGIRKPKMECLEQVFGEPFSWRWFLPFRLPEKVFKEFKRIREDYLEMELSNNDSYLSQKDA